MVLYVILFPIPDQALVVDIESNILFNFGNLPGKGWSHNHGSPCTPEGLFSHHPIDVQPVNLLTVFMKAIESYFFDYKQKDQDRRSQTYGQS